MNKVPRLQRENENLDRLGSLKRFLNGIGERFIDIRRQRQDSSRERPQTIKRLR